MLSAKKAIGNHAFSIRGVEGLGDQGAKYRV